MGYHASRHDTKLIEFGEVRAPRESAASRSGKASARPALIKFRANPRQAVLEEAGSPAAFPPIPGWKLALKHRACRSAESISDAQSTLECVVAGFKRAVRDLGLADVKMPADLSAQMKRSLTYRLPNEAWHAIHGLDHRSQGVIMLEMARSAHDGWARDHVAPLFGRGGDLEYLFLPLELIGRSSFGDVAAAIMRYLPPLGLDLSMSKPSEYDTLYACDALVDMPKSPSFSALSDAFAVARAGFAEANEIDSPEDLARYISAYGEYNGLLGAAASARLRDREFAYKVAMQVSRNDPERIIARW